MVDIKQALELARMQIADRLPKQQLNDDEARRILRRYAAAIEGNFVSWMGATVITARSIQGRYAAEENLWVEMKDDHAGMLRDFSRSAGAEPTLEDYQAVIDGVGRIRSMVAEMSGLKNLALMAVLENTSAAFIPYLEKLAVQLGSQNLIYTKVHGEADAKHADQFAWALEHELKHHDDQERTLNEAINLTTEFLKDIFRP